MKRPRIFDDPEFAPFEHDQVVRQKFHDYLVSVGMAEQETPKGHASYKSSYVQAMWETWVAAVIAERKAK